MRTLSIMRSYAGIVRGGGRRATALGFPTANIPLEDTSISGIFAGRAGVGGKEYEAVVYADKKRKLLEVHLLDFSGDLYGGEMTVTLLHKLREGKKFLSDEEVRAAIAEDIVVARAYFKR